MSSELVQPILFSHFYFTQIFAILIIATGHIWSSSYSKHYQITYLTSTLQLNLLWPHNHPLRATSKTHTEKDGVWSCARASSQPNAPRPSVRPHPVKTLGCTQAPGPTPTGKEAASFPLRPPACSTMLAKVPVPPFPPALWPCHLGLSPSPIPWGVSVGTTPSSGGMPHSPI